MIILIMMTIQPTTAILNINLTTAIHNINPTTTIHNINPMMTMTAMHTFRIMVQFLFPLQMDSYFKYIRTDHFFLIFF